MAGWFLFDHAGSCSSFLIATERERWIIFWKRRVQFFRRIVFHHRLRRDENYAEKSNYVRMNPVRTAIVTDAAAGHIRAS